MNMAALGGYLRTLREGQHISRTGLASQLDVDPATLWRIEEGKQEPGGTLLLDLVAAVRGSYEDVRRLLRSDENGDSGRSLAESRLAAFATEVGEEQVDKIARRLATDPDFKRAIRRAALGIDSE
jgi:transcriptional regulator with XRE-family HTH domain